MKGRERKKTVRTGGEPPITPLKWIKKSGAVKKELPGERGQAGKRKTTPPIPPPTEALPR